MAALKLIQEIKKAEDSAREMIGKAESEAAKALEEAKWGATDEIDKQGKAFDPNRRRGHRQGNWRGSA